MLRELVGLRKVHRNVKWTGEHLGGSDGTEIHLHTIPEIEGAVVNNKTLCIHRDKEGAVTKARGWRGLANVMLRDAEYRTNWFTMSTSGDTIRRIEVQDY